jgi:DNA-binding transcriptional ArsR family regulator
MPSPSVERAVAYLDALEGDRRSALVLSEQKAEEARLIKARQEGFRAAMEILCGEPINRHSGADPTVEDAVRCDPAVKEPVQHAETDPTGEEPMRRRARRPIPQLILRELSFSGKPKTLTQIAKAIGYNPAGTETALKRIEAAGQVLKDEDGRWAIALPTRASSNGHASAA